MSEHSTSELREQNIGPSKEALQEHGERLKKIESSAETAPNDSEKRASEARRDTERFFSKEAGKEKKTAPTESSSPKTIRRITALEKKRAYRQTLSRAQHSMTPTSRAFSKMIHNPVVEKTSDIAGNTIARPNALLFGSLAAFITIAAIYVITKNYGYSLSGFEMMGAYILGWAVGLLIDYFRVAIHGKA